MDNMAARIVRVWKGYVTADGVQQYCDDHFTKTVLPQLRALEGFLCANVLVRSMENETELSSGPAWPSLTSIRPSAVRTLTWRRSGRLSQPSWSGSVTC